MLPPVTSAPEVTEDHTREQVQRRVRAHEGRTAASSIAPRTPCRPAARGRRRPRRSRGRQPLRAPTMRVCTPPHSSTPWSGG
jgi:hypothetical protein